ncbi:uncharacterized protein CTRU02_211174 [Colletotrichum truncatum]|uniref:Uncharacterized protein n=1 Tax=Colletotrichum truncatum TaxID=5467 RepID=A0ACC3YR16_COLTU|nr:uncharacterized protein CTRU02_01955 [Colletotrichum truncatum]KAF6799084.1 hypothetical protein CTRU02_01955 [Colletotrichum truncatum]
MCMRVFALHRCFTEADGGCDNYWAEYVAVEECNKHMLPGLPQADCRAVWGGFEREMSSRVNRHDFYIRHPKMCRICEHAHELARLQAEAERERRGEFSDRVQTLLQNAERRAQLNEGAFMYRCYNEMWDAARNLVGGLGRKADAVWDSIEAALYRHFGVEGLARPDIQGLIASLQDAKRVLVDHVKVTTREMAVALVGPKDNWDEDEETERYQEEDRKRQRLAARKAERVGRRAAREREEEE